MRNAMAFLVLWAGSLAALDEVTDITTAVVKDPGGVPGFSRGDCNQDRKVDIGDAICTLGHLFNHETTTCKAALDSNDDNKVDIADAIYLLSYLFAKGKPPSAPFGPGVCGVDPTPPAASPLACEAHRACGAASATRIVKIASKAKTPITVPLLAVIEQISQPGVTCTNPDGSYKGKPCFDYSAAVSGGALPAGGETEERSWSFAGLTTQPFTLTIRVYGSLGDAGWLPGQSLTGDGAGISHKAGVIEVGTVEYTIEVPGVALTQRDVEAEGKAERFQELSAPRCGTPGMLGMASIPTFTQFVAVPKGAQINVAVKAGNPITYKGMRIMPQQHDPIDYDGLKPPPFVIHKEYTRDAFYPESLWSYEVGIIRGMRIAVIHVALGQFNGATGVLRFYPHLEVDVEFPGAQGKSPASFAEEETRAPGFERLLGATLINQGVAVLGVEASVAGRGFLEFTRDLLIITAPAFHEQAEELAEWKTERGLRTILATTDSTGTTTGDIAAYISGQYTLRGIEYVLFIGDADHIPTFQGSTHPVDPPDGHSPYHMGTDLFYVTMDGAGDFLPDLAIGRISVDDTDQAQRIVTRIKNYEGTLFFDADFFVHPVFSAYFQDSDPQDGQTEKNYVQTCEEIVTYLDHRGYDPTRVYTALWGVNPEHYSDGTDIPSYLLKPTFAWNGTGNDVVNAINAGTFLVAHRDHGARGGWSHPSFTSTMADNLTNGDTLLPLVFSLNCQTGWFDCETDESAYGTSSSTECFGEHLLRASLGGALAVITPTRNSPSRANDQFLRGMIDCVWPSFISDFPGWGEVEAEELAGSRRLGHIMNYGKYYIWSCYGSELVGAPNLDNITRAQFQSELYHCLGDPTVNLRTSSWLTAVVSLSQQECLHVDYYFELPPELDGGLVSILQRGLIMGQGIARDGQVAVKLRKPLEDLADTALNVEREGYKPVSVPLSFTPPKRSVYALRVPRTKLGATDIATYTLDPAGNLTPVATVKAGAPGVQQCCPSGFVGTAEYLFAGTNSGNQISMFACKGEGGLSEVGGSPFETTGQQIAYCAVNDAETRLFARTGDNSLEVFAITSSGLTPVGKPFAIGPAARALATFESFGREWLYVGEDGNLRGVRVYEVLASGLKEVQFFDLGAIASRPGYAMAVAGTARILYVLDLDDGIWPFKIDTRTGRIGLVTKEPVTVGGLSTTMCLTEDEAYLYATLPSGWQVPAIVVFAIAEDGVPERVVVEESCPDIVSLRVTHDRRFLLGASRADDGICLWPILKDGTLGTHRFIADSQGEPAPQMLWVR